MFLLSLLVRIKSKGSYFCSTKRFFTFSSNEKVPHIFRHKGSTMKFERGFNVLLTNDVFIFEQLGLGV